MQKIRISKNNWNNINWSTLQQKLFKWQQRIYLASKEGNIVKVRKLQNLLVNSETARLLAVKKVSQDNTGKKTAGVDGIKSLTPSQRIELSKTLRIPSKASKLRRVWIPKPGKPEKRPLGIPTIKDRALQCLVKFVMEPEWEAKFEPNSYGFRPGRSAHDALKAIYDHVIKRPKYVLDADIKKCFDLINHEALLEKIGMEGKMRKQIKYWLKAGVLDGGIVTMPSAGTPQGGVISPLLANIALHGMETHLKNCFSDIKCFTATGNPIKKNRTSGSLAVIRYADDFVIMHDDLNVIIRCKEEVCKFLKAVGLELSPEKTRCCHTLDEFPMGNKNMGFNFLGYTFKQVKSTHRSNKATNGKLLGHKTLVYPSIKACQKHQETLHEIILKKGKRLNQDALINKLNPIIRGWSNYFGKFDSNTTGILVKQDYLLYLKLRKWASRQQKSSKKGLNKYWKKDGTRKWVFKSIEHELLEHISYSEPKITKVIGDSSPYDGNAIYWTKRLSTSLYFNTRTKILLNSQKGICKWCNYGFREGDVLEIDHIIPRFHGGKDIYTNLQLLHRNCHDSKTAQDNEKYPKTKNNVENNQNKSRNSKGQYKGRWAKTIEKKT